LRKQSGHLCGKGFFEFIKSQKGERRMKKVGLMVCAFVLIFSTGSMAQVIFQ